MWQNGDNHNGTHVIFLKLRTILCFEQFTLKQSAGKQTEEGAVHSMASS
jgi:hypothetical protein